MLCTHYGYRVQPDCQWDKLDKNNYPAWKFRMTNFLQGKGYWDYIDGENEAARECPIENSTPEQRKALKDWTQGKSKVMHWLSMSTLQMA